MSAVLSAPTMNPIFKTLLHDPEFKSFLKGEILTLIEEDPELKKSLRGFIDCAITMSEHNMLKRIANLEKALGLGDYPGFEDEHKMSIPEQISLLAERIDNITEPIQETVIEPRTTLEFKATEFAIHVRDVTTKTGKTFLKSNEIMDFMKSGLSEPLRMKDIKNPRQFKKDVIQKASKMFPFIVLDKKKEGRRDVRVVYKPENDTKWLNHTDTYRRSKPT